MNPDKLVVFVFPDTGTDFDGFVTSIERLVVESLVQTCVLLTASNGMSLPTSAMVFGKEGASAKSLDDYVASFRNLKSLNLVGIATESYSDEKIELAKKFLDQLGEHFRNLVSVNTIVNEIRVCAPSFDLFDLSKSHFSTGASNWVLIPEDRSLPISVARPMNKETPSFMEHVSFEVCSLLGLWKGFSFDPNSINQVNVGGRTDPQVRFARSFVRLVHGPLPTTSTVIAERGPLPTANGYEPFPDPEWAARQAATRLFPEKFTFWLPDREDDRLKLGKMELIRRFVKEIGQAILRAPGFYVRGITADLESAAALGVQSIYGENSWIVLGDLKGEGDGTKPNSLADLQARLIAQTERPNLNEVASSVWVDFVDAILALIDGGEKAEQIRRELGSSSYLLVDREFLAFKPPNSISEYITRRGSNDVNKESESFADELVIEATQLDQAKLPDKVMDLDTNTAHEDLSVGAQSEPGAIDEGKSLLGLLGKRFRSERAYAENALISAIERIRSHELRSSEVSAGVSKGVVVLILSALTVLLILRTSFTSWHTAFSFESLGGVDRARLWVIFTLVLLYSTSLNLIPDSEKRAQMYFVVSSAFFAGSVAASLLYFGPIYRSVRSGLKWTGEAPIFAITGLAILLVLFAFSRRSRRGMRSRKIRRMVMFGLLYCYLVSGAIVSLSGENSFVWQMSSAGRTRLTLFLVLVSSAVLAASLIIVAIIRVREQNRFVSSERDLRWNILIAEHSAKQLKVLALREIQWLGTSLAMSRLIWNPLGAKSDASSAFVGRRYSSSLNKFHIETVSLNEQGVEYLSARTRRMFAGKGWLHGQYERAVRSFLTQRANQVGADDDELSFLRPETCSYPETAESLSRGELSSRRWEFASSLIGGELDAKLRDEALSEVILSSYREVLKKPQMHSFSDREAESVQAFLSQLEDPVQGQSNLPAKILSLAPLSFAGSNATPERYYWYPKDDFETENQAAVNSSHPLDSADVLFMAGILEVSSPVLLPDLVSLNKPQNVDAEVRQGRGL